MLPTISRTTTYTHCGLVFIMISKKVEKQVKQIVLAGARPDTGNHGCAALSVCATTGLLQRLHNVQLTIFDLGIGMRDASIAIDGKRYSYRKWGAVNSRKLYKKSAFWNMRVSALLGLKGNSGAVSMKEADAVFDISSGDSFGDLYGEHRFYDDILPKLIAVENKRNLILLPQTYGPYRKPKNKEIARRIVKSSFHSWARDEHSFEIMKDLLGDDFDPDNHHSGVDLAFLLPVINPRENGLTIWIQQKRVSGESVVGINVSGLLYEKPDYASKNYEFRANYDTVINNLIEYLLKEPSNNLVLVPHVEAGGMHDRDISEQILSRLQEKYKGRISIVPRGLQASEVKHVIASLDWFCGTRMHSAIAGLSSCVPTTAIAYSLKTKGVFETCGQGGQVVDPRTSSTDQLYESIADQYEHRSDCKAILEENIPQVKQRAKIQMDMIASCVN